MGTHTSRRWLRCELVSIRTCVLTAHGAKGLRLMDLMLTARLSGTIWQLSHFQLWLELWITLFFFLPEVSFSSYKSVSYFLRKVWVDYITGSAVSVQTRTATIIGIEQPEMGGEKTLWSVNGCSDSFCFTMDGKMRLKSGENSTLTARLKRNDCLSHSFTSLLLQ